MATFHSELNTVDQISVDCIKMNRWPFVDLNIKHNPLDKKMTLDMVKLAIELGYDAVALNIDIGNPCLNEAVDNQRQAFPMQQQKKRQQTVIGHIPLPFLIPQSTINNWLPKSGDRQRFRQFSRITFTVRDVEMVHVLLKHPTILQYDIVAVYPETEAAFLSIVQKTEIDLLTSDPYQRPCWVMKTKLLLMATEKGIPVELQYAAGLQDSGKRRAALCCGRELVGFRGCTKGVVLSSGAKRPIELRSPYDAANLSTLYGLTAAQGRRANGETAKKVLLKAEAKQLTIKGVMAVQKVPEVAGSLLAKLALVPEFRAEISSGKIVSTGNEETTNEAKDDSDGVPAKKMRLA